MGWKVIVIYMPFPLAFFLAFSHSENCTCPHAGSRSLIFFQIGMTLPSLIHPTLPYPPVLAQASLLTQSLFLKSPGRNNMPYLMSSLCSYVFMLFSHRICKIPVCLQILSSWRSREGPKLFFCYLGIPSTSKSAS